MKKTTLFLLGALIASVMPGTGLRAQQNVQLNVEVRTLDRATLSSVTIYAATPGQTYFIDSDHLMPTWTGTALELTEDNCDTSVALTAVLQDNGSYLATATVDSLVFASSMIVARDANDRYYVLGSASREALDTGYFSPATLLTAAVEHEYSPALTPANNLVGTDRVMVYDEVNNYYSSFANALSATEVNRMLYFADTIRLSDPVSISVPLTINQRSFPVVSSFAADTQALVKVCNGASVNWVGTGNPSDFVLPATSGDLFHVVGGMFVLSKFQAEAVMSPIVADSGAVVNIINSVLASAKDSAALTLKDSSSATVMTLNVTSAVFAGFADSATGVLAIYDSTAAATPAAINADAYFNEFGYRKYLRNLTLTAAAAGDSIVYLARNTTPGRYDTIFDAATIDLNGYMVKGGLCVAHDSRLVTIHNGKINYLKGTENATGNLELFELDSVASFVPGDLAGVVIRDGRYKVITPLTGANVQVLGGKYDCDVNAYLPERYALVANTDVADSASFHYKVVQGFLVTLKNFNGRETNAAFTGLTDTTLIVNTTDNKITPAPARPAYVGSDTIFAAYYIDQEFSTPWHFLDDVLTSDTTLYARWFYYNSATDGRYTVYHYRQDLDGTYPESMVDSIQGVATIGDSLIVNAYVYEGFEADKAADTTASFADGAVINFHYARKSYVTTFVLNGGVDANGDDTVVSTFLYGDSVVYPTVTRPGYTFTGWNPVVTTMPAHNCTVYALYDRNSYPLSWTHVDTTVTYNGMAYNDIVATYTDDNSNSVAALLSITDADGNPVTETRTVGTYTFTAAPVDTNYLLVGTLVNHLTIVPAPVVATGISVVADKLYDGNTSVVVNNMGTPSPIYSNDDLGLTTVASYDSPAVGENKTITAYMTLTGADKSNYVLTNNTQEFVGAIVAPIVLDEDQGDNGIVVDADGYCSGDNSAIQYVIDTDNNSGVPDQYKLVYDSAAHAEGFADVAWTNITSTTGDIDITIPVDATYGIYTATLTLRNSLHPEFESSPITVSFVVNVSRNFTMPIFDDVISIVDTCHCIDQSSIKWYHNGTYVGDGPYYQEVGGLTGTYHVTMTMNGNDVRTCEQTDMNTIVPEAESLQTTVSTYPNPVVDQVNVTIENSVNATHSLRIMNVMGVTLVNTTFEGQSTTVDFSTFGAGSYTVSVDGIVARVIKY